MRLILLLALSLALTFVLWGQGIIALVPLILVGLALVTALSFVFFGELLIDLLPSVRRFRRTHQAWGALVINGKSIRLEGNPNLSDFGKFRFQEISESPTHDITVYEVVRNKRCGDVIAAVSYKERELRNLMKEIRGYSFFYIILFTVGILMNMNSFLGKSLIEISQLALSHHVIPLLEVIMIGWLLIRLGVETQSVKSLLEGE